MGGGSSKNTTEIVRQDGSVEMGFDLVLDTWWAINLPTSASVWNRYFRSACAIPDPDSSSVIITGGVGQYGNVYRYTMAGWAGALPSLHTGRYWHACGSYVTHDSRGGGVENIFLSQ